MLGYYRIALCTPSLKVGNVSANAAEIGKMYHAADANGASVVCFPELSLTGYTCADLFQAGTLLDAVVSHIGRLATITAGKSSVLIVGAPLRYRDRCLNTAIVLQGGKVAGIVPKSFIPNYKEFYEKRWFVSGAKIKGEAISLDGQKVAMGVDLLFDIDSSFRFGVEICEDLWTAVPPSTHLALGGAQVIFNLSASNELVGKSDYRRNLVRSQSARLLAAYAYVSSGPSESTTDLVFSGHRIVAENSQIITDALSTGLGGDISYADVDVFKLSQLRRSETSFSSEEIPALRTVPLNSTAVLSSIEREIERFPFVPSDDSLRADRCSEILTLQSLSLAKRCAHTKVKSLLLGLSGGLDSTLAALVCLKACSFMEKPVPILAVSMPGFGTSETTRKNAKILARALKLDFKEIDITSACQQHFADIGHDAKTQDLTFENVQARERTQILMDLANKEQGLVVGTGDLSEIALGWSTFNADHMSMYNVNCGVPKTLVRHLIRWFAKQCNSKELEAVLQAILATPISPELTKADGQDFAQKTEDIIGPYEVQDFFLYHFLRYGAGPRRILTLAMMAFGSTYKESQLRGWLRLFIQRFFANQFKRNCIPDGPKIGTISLSPRGDWRMPSDASAEEWLKELT